MIALERTNGKGAYRVLNGDVKKCNFTVKIRKKWSFVPNFEMNVVSPKIISRLIAKAGKTLMVTR